jgi:PAS domain S-box-containing protein
MSSTGHLSELDLLRSQVADLSRELAERNRAAQDLREQSALLRAIAEGTAAETGEEFFSALVTHLTSVLHVQYAIIGEVQGDRIKKIRTLAVSAGGTLGDNFEYDLARTPCATTLTQTFAYFARDLQATFPQFQRLADLGAESYCAVPLRTKSGAVIGLLVVMDTKPLEHGDYLQSLLGVFAPRVAAEFERRRAEQERAQAQADLHNVIEAIPDIVFALNTQGNMVKWNRRVVDVTGYSPEELLNKPALAFVPPEEQMHTATAIQRAFTEGYAELEGHLLTKDHRLIPYHWTGALLKNSYGEPIGITGIGRDVSDKKRAEEAVRESEERLALAVEGSNDILWDAHRLPGEPWYAPQTPIWWSSRVRELLGLQESDSFETFEQWVVRLHPDDKDHVFGQLAAHIEQRVPYDVEYRLRTNAGDYRWIRGRGQALWDEQGEPRRMSGSCQDITDRKRAEEALCEKQRQLTEAQRLARIGSWHWAVETDTVTWSDELYAIFGRDPKQPAVSYKDHPKIYTADSYARLEKAVTQALATGARYELELEFIHADKTHRWGVARGEPVEGEGARILSLHGTFQDITERRQVEQSLHASEERFTLAVHGSNTGIWDWDLRTGKTYFSPLWKSMLGYEEHELRGELFEWEERLHPDDRKRSSATVRAYLEGVTPQYELEHRLRHKDGSYRWILTRGVSISDAEGKPYRMAGSHVDITEQKQTQEALAQSERQLRTVLDALPVGVWFTDRAGKPLLANPAAKQIWSNIKQIGLQDSNNQSGWWESIGPANEPHRWALSQVLTTGVPSLNETFDFECLDGTKKAIRNSTVPVQNQDGVTLGAIVLNEDITLLRQAQAALQLTQFSVDHAVEGFLWIGPDARIFHVNDSICRMLEYTWDELTTMTLHEIDPNLSSELWSAQWEELRQKGSLTFELKYWSRTGRVLDMEVTVNYLQYEGKEYNCAIMRDIGERKRGEAAFRASEERYRSLYDETPTMYFTLATDGRVLSVNRFGAEQLGYQAGELIGHSVLGLFHEDDKEGVVASLSECLATPEITRYWEFRKVRKDGSMIWVRETARVGQSSAEETVVLVTCEDITARRINEQLLAAEKRILELIAIDVPLQEVLTLMCQAFEKLSNRAHYSILLLDFDGLHLRHGAAPSLPEAYVHAIDGVAIGPAVGSCGTAAFMRRQVIVSDISCDPLWADFRDLALGHGLRACWSTPVIASDGTVLGTFAVYYGNPQQPTEADLLLIGRAAHIACIAIERKQTADALHMSEERLNLAARGSNTGIWDWNLRTNEVYFSPIWKSMLGYTEHELRGEFSEWEARIHPDDLARAQAAVRGYLAGVTPQYELEHRLRHKDGSYRWILARGITLSDAAGNPYRMAGSHIDITERKGMEETLRQRERALRTAIEERERISQDLHDGILQSLFAVGLALESAKLTMSPRNLRTSRTSLNQAIDQLNDVMREIRNFIAGLGSDLLQGKNFPAVLKQMLASLTEHQVTRVRLAVEDRAAKALSTEQSLHLIRVIQEAVSNCIKHGHAREARVSLKMLKRGVRLSIRDNGRGFNQDDVKGIGYGLGNMAARAQKIGGRFAVLSKVNEGTSIVLDLPKEVADAIR